MKLTSMKMKNIALAFTLLTSAFGAFAQEGENLVDNGGFESVSGKPKKMGQIDLATGWYSPTGAPADLFLKNTNSSAKTICLLETLANSSSKLYIYILSSDASGIGSTFER